MAKSVLELAVGTGQWDAGLKKAKSALDNFTQSQGGLQQALAKDSENIRKFVSMMGQTESTAKTAKGQMNDYKSTIEQLTMQYNRMTEAQKNVIGQDYLQAIEQMKQKYHAVSEEIQEMNRSLNNAKMPDMKDGVGGLFGGGKLDGMLQVFGGNLMTKGAGMLAGLASEMADMVKQGMELARQGEGIRIAFERLGRGDILDGLRQATHGTVTDIELMKAAVKFNDFKLPLDELGTMLAFAQQKAKDTGQSVDYMVDSIVTGLGRKSLMILDNLGLSATEIRERMKETGDMTKAVGAIIREQMASAGEYVETAADRAAQANVSLQNKMEELGRKFAPIEEASNQLWTSMKIGILDIIGGPLATLLNQLTEAGRLKNALNDINGDGSSGNTVVGGKLKQLQAAKNSGASQYMLNTMQSSTIEGYNRQIMKADELLKQFEKNHSSVNVVLQNATKQFGQKFSSISELEAFRDAYKVMVSDYQKGASEIMKPVNANVNTKKAEQNVASLREQLKELEEQRKKAVKAGDQEQVESLTKQISQTKTNLGYLDPKSTKTGSSTKTAKTELQQNQTKINALTQEYVKLGNESTEAARERQVEIQKEIELLQQRNGLLGLRAEQAQGRLTLGAGDFQRDGLSNTPGTLLKAPTTAVYEDGVKSEKAVPSGGLLLDDKAMKAVTKNLEKLQKKDEKKEDSLSKEIGDIAGGVSGMFSGLQQLGIELPEGLQGVLNGITGVTQILTSIMTIVSAIQAITAADSIIPFANGGVVRAAGGVVAGNTYSGDQIPALLNAGEVVLNRAQVGNLASQLQGGSMQNLNLTATIKGEQIRLALNNNGRRTGRGEYVQSRNVR